MFRVEKVTPRIILDIKVMFLFTVVKMVTDSGHLLSPDCPLRGVVNVSLLLLLVVVGGWGGGGLSCDGVVVIPVMIVVSLYSGGR